MSEKELDDLFKEAADGFKIHEDPSAWTSMSARLDEADRTPFFWNWKAITGVAVIGLTSVSVWWYSSSSSLETDFKNQGTLIQDVNKIDEKKVESPNTVNETTGTPDLSETTRSEVLIQTENDERSAKGKSGVKQNTRTQTELIQPPVNSEVTPGNSTNQVTKKSDEDTSVKNLADRESEQELVLSGRSTQVINDSSELSIASFLNKGSGDRTLINVSGDSLQKDTVIVVAKVQIPSMKDSLSTPEKSEKNNSAGHKVSIKLSVSPDFSSIKYFTPDKSGINYGIQIGYNFSKRWSIFTGAILSRKIYTSTEIEKAYTSPRGYDYPVIKLTGDCRVVDIPLNVYYTFHPGNSISFRAGIGVSSYLMLSEDYTYFVDNPYGSDVYSQSIDNENNEWFKMANVSFTIQKRIRERFYVEFEPFLKTPLGGVGEGDVTLVSLGAFLNLRYDIF